MKREHGTAYAKIVETAEGSNKFDIFIGKQGVNGKPTYSTELKGKSFSTVDNRSQDPATVYTPKAMSADGKTKDSKSETPAIVISLIEQLVKKFIAEKPVKAPKAPKAPKEPKVKAEKPAKAAKEKVAKVKKEKAAKPAETAPVSEQAESVAEGEKNVVLVDGLRYNYSVDADDMITKVTVSRNGKEVKTTIAPKSSDEEVMASVTGLAQRLANNFQPQRKAAKK